MEMNRKTKAAFDTNDIYPLEKVEGLLNMDR